MVSENWLVEIIQIPQVFGAKDYFGTVSNSWPFLNLFLPFPGAMLGNNACNIYMI